MGSSDHTGRCSDVFYPDCPTGRSVLALRWGSALSWVWRQAQNAPGEGSGRRQGLRGLRADLDTECLASVPVSPDTSDHPHHK